MKNRFRLARTDYARETEEQKIEPQKIFYLSVEGNVTEQQYFAGISKYREQLGMFAMFTNLFGNVLIFMPFGFFMPVACKNRRFFSAFFYSFGLSLCVETFQLVAKVGSFDVDDLLLNTVGGAAGYVLYAGCNAIRRRYVYKKKKR